MSFGSTKTALFLSRNFRLNDLNIGIFSFIRNRKLNFLKESLQVNSRREVDFREELRSQENHFLSLTEQKTHLAHELLNGERRWKTALEGAEKKKAVAASAYMSQFLRLNLNIHRTRQDLESSSVKLDHDSALQLLEDQKMELRNAESQLMSATKELDALKEKPQDVINLVKQFREARDNSHQASVKYQMVKTNWTNINKDILRINNLIQSINDSVKPSSFTHVMSTRFWRSVREMLVINLRQRKYSL